jgi:hypothetical protein
MVLTGLLSGGAALAEPSLVWSDQHDGGDNFVDDGWCLLTDSQGNLVVGGESSDPFRGIDLYVRKLDRTDGHELWGSRFSGYDEKDVAICDMTWDTVGQLLVAGFIRGCVG